MKQLGCLLLVVGVVAVAFFGVVTFVVTGADDQSALTSEVEGRVVDAQRRSAGPNTPGYEYEFAIVYTYRVDGDSYRDDTRLTEVEWQPGRDLTVCVDPDEHTAHVVKVEAEPCGSESVNFGSISTSTPTATRR